jgi:moderate conductance mechanosensitive channel
MEPLFAAWATRVAAGGGSAADLQRACGSPGSRTWLCETVFRITGSTGAADVADAFDRPARIALILLVAFIATLLARRLVHRFAQRLKAGTTPGTATTAASGRRRAQRAETAATVLRSVVSIAIWTIAVITVLGELGIELAPLLAGAGVAGVALGFGAQAVVRDFLAGTFMLLEDQYGVGDVIDVGVAAGSSATPVAGTVESVSLRVTRLRDVEGTVWFVPNGEIHRVGNKAQQWARAVLDLAVAPSTDLDAATDVINRVAHDLRADSDWTHRIPSEPEVWGVEELHGDRVVLRLVVRTLPLAQWDVARELRARLKRAFDEAGIELAVAALITTHDTRPNPNGEDQAPQTDG